ncbi:MAG: HAMP domain-containing sensor histidine kinase [Bacillota bacterium]
MISIKQKISRPYFMLILGIPLAITLLFNLLVVVYSYVESKSSLEYATFNLERTLEHMEQPGNETDRINMLMVMQNNTRVGNIELLTFDARGRLSRMRDGLSSFITDEVVERAYEVATTTNGTVSFSIGIQNYHAEEIELGLQRNSVGIDKAIYVASARLDSDFIFAINMILLIVSVAVIGIFGFVSRKISNGIARPILEIVNSLALFKADTLVLLPEDKSSTELFLLTTKFNELNEKIYQHNQSQKTFLNNASHELRTPLMNIQGYADGISMGIFADSKGTAELISEQTKRLTTLVDRLLILGRTENFDSKQNLTKQNISNFLTEFLHLYYGYTKTKDIQLKKRIGEDIYCMANDELLRQSIGNILSNALRYAKMEVVVSLEKTKTHAILTIADDGEGIADFQEIFTRFHKGEGGNFGLGLSIAKTAVDMMYGTITAGNENGAVFVIALPLENESGRPQLALTY